MKKKIKNLIIRKARANRYEVDCDPFLEELIVNSEEIYDSYIAEGKTSKDAYQLTLKQIGDLDEYFKDKSMIGEHTFGKQKTIHNLLSVGLVLLSVVLVALYYWIHKLSPLIFVGIDIIVFLATVAYKLKLNQKIYRYQMFKSNLDRMFYFCAISKFIIILPIMIQFNPLQYILASGIIIFLINLFYIMVVDKQIKPSFLLSIIALTLSLIYYSYSMYSAIMMFFIVALIFTGVFYIKQIINNDVYGFIFIIVGSLLIILTVFLLELLKYTEIIFSSFLIVIMLFLIFNKKFNVEQKINKVKSILSIFIIFHILGINLFLLNYYINNYKTPEFIPFTYIFILYQPIIFLIVLEYLNNFIFYLVKNYYYKKKGEHYEENFTNRINFTRDCN